MNRWYVALVVTGAASCALAGIVAGCGSTDATIEDADSGVDSGLPSSSGMTSGNPSSSGGPSDGGGGGEGGGDGGGDGGGTPTPDSVRCGAVACDTNQDVCCLSYVDGGATCQNDCTASAMQLECDDNADCGGGDVCCLGGNPGQGFQATCNNGCQGQEPQLCQTNAECGTNGPCNLKSCFGKQLRVCGSPALCN
jgi:hypothetical protein